MTNIEITIHCPELALLAAALQHAPVSVPAHPMPAPANPTPGPATASAGPAMPSPVTSAVPFSAPAPSFAPPPTAPVAAAPTYTLDQITRAGADLAQAGKMPQLMALLQQLGVQTVGQVPPERYGEVAAALRGLGAQI